MLREDDRETMPAAEESKEDRPIEVLVIQTAVLVAVLMLAAVAARVG